MYLSSCFFPFTASPTLFFLPRLRYFIPTTTGLLWAQTVSTFYVPHHLSPSPIFSSQVISVSVKVKAGQGRSEIVRQRGGMGGKGGEVSVRRMKAVLNPQTQTTHTSTVGSAVAPDGRTKWVSTKAGVEGGREEGVSAEWGHVRSRPKVENGKGSLHGDFWSQTSSVPWNKLPHHIKYNYLMISGNLWTLFQNPRKTVCGKK